MERQLIRSIRRGSVQWNEEDRLQLATLLVKCGYTVKLSNRVISGQAERAKAAKEYVIEFWEDSNA